MFVLSKKMCFLFSVILLVVNCFIYRAVFAPRELIATVLEQGSAVLVRTQSGSTVLVDAGPDASILRALGAVLPVWRRRIDIIIFTGSAADVRGGLSAIKERYRVGRVVETSPNGTKTHRDALRVTDGSTAFVIYEGRVLRAD